MAYRVTLEITEHGNAREGLVLEEAVITEVGSLGTAVAEVKRILKQLGVEPLEWYRYGR